MGFEPKITALQAAALPLGQSVNKKTKNKKKYYLVDILINELIIKNTTITTAHQAKPDKAKWFAINIATKTAAIAGIHINAKIIITIPIIPSPVAKSSKVT